MQDKKKQITKYRTTASPNPTYKLECLPNDETETHASADSPPPSQDAPASAAGEGWGGGKTN